ncbi:PAS domain-containing protein [Rubellimicrobium rubrum]|uniref:PAS domain-containing protein n=1 Tax=Rubellimicrobium rubrum TaxID=2585369 RepID=A0A5C4N2Q4_9RHOB|nr:PAS domain-containing protein [Rubellimicrobium rubrum]TNC52964.1 PAS domain-containing protein [Rubellimicrobium rubrum]
MLGIPLDIEARIHFAGGACRWTRSRAYPFWDELGRMPRWHGTTENTHDRHEADKAQRASEELTWQILSGSPDCIKLLTLDAKLEFFSARGPYAMEGEDFEKQLRGTDWLSFWQPEDRLRVRQAIIATL